MPFKTSKKGSDVLMQPLVSVILPVYNGAKTIKRAVESILVQSFSNFELIIINDGSNDETPQILNSFTDSRIKILHQENSGITVALNKGVEAANGKYIARMDADDISLPERLEKQVNFLEAHPDIAVVGCANKIIYQDGKEAVRYRAFTHNEIMKNFVKITPVPHSSVIMRKDALIDVGLYDPKTDGSKKIWMTEDYDLWVRFAKKGYKFANLPDILLINEREATSITRSVSLIYLLKMRVIIRKRIIKALGLPKSYYLQIGGVLIASFINYFGFRLDRVFNWLSKGNK